MINIPWVSIAFVLALWVVLILPVLFMDRVIASLESARSSIRWAVHRLRIRNYHHEWTRIVIPRNGGKPKALLVLLHGLNGHPIKLEQHRIQADSSWAVWCPFIHRLGNDALPYVLAPLKQ
jgi:hypothetical protein